MSRDTGNYKTGICRECKVRNKDSSKKRLYKCYLCGEWFCEYHLDPKVAFIKDLLGKIKDPKWQLIVEKDWKRDSGHPCIPYTKYKIRELELEEQKEFKLIEKLLSKKRRIAYQEYQELQASQIPDTQLSESKKCFIATAIYGTSLAPEINILRKFRDNVLMKDRLGQFFVNCYYLISPPIAHIISKNTFLKLIVRKIVIQPLLNELNKHRRII